MYLYQDSQEDILILQSILKKIFLNNPKTRNLKNYRHQESYHNEIYGLIQAQNNGITNRLPKETIDDLIELERTKLNAMEDQMEKQFNLDQTGLNQDTLTNQDPLFRTTLDQNHSFWMNNSMSSENPSNQRLRNLSQQVSRPTIIANRIKVTSKGTNLNPESSDIFKKRSESLKSPRRTPSGYNYQIQNQNSPHKKQKRSRQVEIFKTLIIHEIKESESSNKKQQELASVNELLQKKDLENNQQNVEQREQNLLNEKQNFVDNKKQVYDQNIKKETENIPFTVLEEESKLEQSPVAQYLAENNYQISQNLLQQLQNLPGETGIDLTQPVVPQQQRQARAQNTQEARQNLPQQVVQQQVLQNQTQDQDQQPQFSAQNIQNPIQNLPQQIIQQQVHQNQVQDQQILNQNYIYLENQNNQFIRTIIRDIKEQLRVFKYKFKKEERQRPRNQLKITSFFTKQQTKTDNSQIKQRLKNEKFNIGNLLFKFVIDSNQRLIPVSCEYITKRSQKGFYATDVLPILTTDLQKLTGLQPKLRKQRYEQLYRQLRLL